MKKFRTKFRTDLRCKRISLLDLSLPLCLPPYISLYTSISVYVYIHLFEFVCVYVWIASIWYHEDIAEILDALRWTQLAVDMNCERFLIDRSFLWLFTSSIWWKMTKVSGITEDSNQNKTWAEPDTGNFCWIRHKLDIISQPVMVILKADTSNCLQCGGASNLLSYNLKTNPGTGLWFQVVDGTGTVFIWVLRRSRK